MPVYTSGTDEMPELTVREGTFTTRGLPAEVLAALDDSMKLYLPMQANSRSLNLSNTVAVVLFEAWKQIGFAVTFSKLERL